MNQKPYIKTLSKEIKSYNHYFNFERLITIKVSKSGKTDNLIATKMYFAF